MYSEQNTSPSSQRPSRGWTGRLGWQRHVQGMTGEDLGWQGVYRGWQREAKEDRGHEQGMIGAEKWHRGYVQGVARDGGEVQGMTGMERDFHWDSGFWNQYCSLTMHITEHLILVCMSVFFLFFCLSIHLSFCLSIHVKFSESSHSLWIQGCTSRLLSFSLLFQPNFFTYRSCCMYFLNVSNVYALVFAFLPFV